MRAPATGNSTAEMQKCEKDSTRAAAQQQQQQQQQQKEEEGARQRSPSTDITRLRRVLPSSSLTASAASRGSSNVTKPKPGGLRAIHTEAILPATEQRKQQGYRVQQARVACAICVVVWKKGEEGRECLPYPRKKSSMSSLRVSGSRLPQYSFAPGVKSGMPPRLRGGGDRPRGGERERLRRGGDLLLERR